MTDVRPARAADRPALRALQSTLPEAAPALLDAAFEGPPAEALVATDAGGPVGYALVVPGESVYLAELVVAPGHRGAGHGSALLSAVRERYDGDELRTVARADDERARSFYEDHGFRVVERHPDRFEDAAGVLLVRDP